MAVYRVTTVFHRSSGLPEDDCTSTVHFETNEPLANSATALLLATEAEVDWHTQGPAPATAPLDSLLAESVRAAEKPHVRVYQAGSFGSPLAVRQWVNNITDGLSNNDWPSEVAIRLNLRGDTTGIPEQAPDGSDPGSAPDRPAARRRGGIWIGPLGDNGGGGVPNRPNNPMMNACLGYALNLGGNATLGLDAINARPVIASFQTGSLITTDVITADVDDAWDTMRSRGVARTERRSTII